MRTITKRLEIDAGHRLMKHEGKCRSVHGHHYAFEVVVGAESLDDVGRVIDFSVIKEKVGAWLDRYFDHGFIAQHGDPIIDWLLAERQKVTVLDSPPSIEHLVECVFFASQWLLREDGVQVVGVTGFETPTSSAYFGAGDALKRQMPNLPGIGVGHGG